MLESIKKDRVIQLLIAVAILIAMMACIAFGSAGWRYLQRLPAITPTPGPSPTPIVLQFNGTGDKVIFFDAPASGAGLIGFYHNGNSNFIVNLMKDDGTFIDQPANAIGEYKGEKTLNIDKGRYMLEISAN